jgi:hypothetical protein
LDFETTDRFLGDPQDPTAVRRCRWTTPVDGWQEAHGRQLPTRAQAIWHPPEGDLPYADFTFRADRIWFDLPPGARPEDVRILGRAGPEAGRAAHPT